MALVIEGTTCLSTSDGSGWIIETCHYNYVENKEYIAWKVQDYWLAIINFWVIIFLFILPYILIFKLLKFKSKQKLNDSNIKPEKKWELQK